MQIITDIIGNPVLGHLVTAALFPIVGWMVGRVLKLVLQFLNRKLAQRTASVFDNLILEVLERRVVLLIVVLAVYAGLDEVRLAIPPDESLWLTLLSGLDAVVYLLVIAMLGLVTIEIISAIVQWYMRDIATKTATRLDNELMPFVRRVLNLLVVVVALIIVLDHFGQNVSSLVVSLGVGSLAIALAAQDTLSNMIAGFVLMVDRPFRQGDWIRLPDGQMAEVQEIGLRSTKIIDLNHVMMIIPNSNLVKDSISNLSYPNDVTRLEVPFSVAYGTDLEMMTSFVLDKIAREEEIERDPPPEIFVEEMADSGINCTLYCFYHKPGNIPRFQNHLLRVVYRTLNEHDIEIPFPQRVVHFAGNSQPGFPDNTGERRP